ncbi:hypothetical protein BC940DRAFT_334113 [Gongronella butleri]|nr:hypothetical protein BC940DRAFT_334113 [Gongronella butleri]
MNVSALPRIFDLPSEILLEILDGFSDEELLNLRLTSKQWDRVVCPLLFRELVLQKPVYVMDPIQDLIASLTNDAQPSLSIGNYVRVIRIESRAMSTKELYRIAQQCPSAKTLEIPFKTLREMNQILFSSATTSKKKRAHRGVNKPADLEMQELFKGLFTDTSIQKLCVPGAVNGDLFQDGIIHCLGGLRQLDLGSTVCPPHVPTAFDLGLLELLHSVCPVLESLTCAISSAGRTIDIQALRAKKSTSRPVFWPSMRRLAIRFVDCSTDVHGYTIFRHSGARARKATQNDRIGHPDEAHPLTESTLMLAYLALAMPNLENLKYESRMPELDDATAVSNLMCALRRHFGAPENWRDSFPRLQRAELLSLELNSYMECILYGPSMLSVTMKECAWVHNPSCAAMLKEMMAMEHLTTLHLTISHPYQYSINIRRERAPRDKFYIDQVLDALPNLLVISLHRHWYIKCSTMPRVPIRGAASPCLTPHPLRCFKLRFTTVENSAVLEYISQRCPDFYMLELREACILATDPPETLRALQPSVNSSQHDLQARLVTLQAARNVIWLPFLYNSLRSITISDLRCPQLDDNYYHYVGIVQAPNYTRDEGHDAKCVNLFKNSVYQGAPGPLPAEEFFTKEGRLGRLVLLTKTISNDFYHIPGGQILNL